MPHWLPSPVGSLLGTAWLPETMACRGQNVSLAFRNACHIFASTRLGVSLFADPIQYVTSLGGIASGICRPRLWWEACIQKCDGLCSQGVQRLLVRCKTGKTGGKLPNSRGVLNLVTTAGTCACTGSPKSKLSTAS